jgi:hypothetical protein
MNTNPLGLVPPDQGLLGLKHKEYFIDRSPELIARMGLQVRLFSREKFPFDRFVETPALQFELLGNASRGWESITIGNWLDGNVPTGAHSKLMRLAEKPDGTSMPLCLWAIDVALGLRMGDGDTVSLPPKPNPGRRLIILTQGRFSQGGDEEYSSHIVFRENGIGGYEPMVMNRYTDIIMYQSPFWDVVALCVPRSSVQ